ncbi:MAG TPA: hypothetical protein ENI89_01945 [Desulfobulbus sp.]|nr:hypothetical protein [Desulfobulbus sp.]
MLQMVILFRERCVLVSDSGQFDMADAPCRDRLGEPGGISDEEGAQSYVPEEPKEVIDEPAEKEKSRWCAVYCTFTVMISPQFMEI